MISIPLVEGMINTLIDTLLADSDFSFAISINWKFALMGYLVIIIVYLISMARTERNIKKVLLSGRGTTVRFYDWVIEQGLAMERSNFLPF